MGLCCNARHLTVRKINQLVCGALPDSAAPDETRKNRLVDTRGERNLPVAAKALPQAFDDFPQRIRFAGGEQPAVSGGHGLIPHGTHLLRRRVPTRQRRDFGNTRVGNGRTYFGPGRVSIHLRLALWLCCAYD